MSNNVIQFTSTDVSNNIVKINDEITEELKIVQIFTQDFDRTRTNVLNIIEKSNIALEDFSELAQQSGHPKSYEALAALIKTTLEANKTLLDLHQTSKRFTGEAKSGGKSGQINTNGNTNIIMVGTTKEMLAMLRKDEDV